MPEGAVGFEVVGKQKTLVGSAEQGFLSLAIKGFITPGKYQAITPCFRDESFDSTHTKYFMKNELFILLDNNLTLSAGDVQAKVRHVLSDAMSFFESEVSIPVTSVVTNFSDTSYSVDLEINGIEVGSYGVRSAGHLTWIYGSGCAEPRMTIAMNTRN